jgi:hypothetical protein
MRRSKCTKEARKCTRTNCRVYIAISILQINDTTLLLLLCHRILFAVTTDYTTCLVLISDIFSITVSRLQRAI